MVSQKNHGDIEVTVYPNHWQEEEHVDYFPIGMIVGIIKQERLSKQISKIRSLIKDEFYKETKRKLKSDLGVFQPTLNASTTTGIVQFDLDIYNDDAHVRKIQDDLVQNIPSLLYSFRSPSNGLKFAIMTDFTDKDSQLFPMAYDVAESAISASMANKKIELDRSCRKVKQLCYISSDPDAYINPTPEPLPVFEEAKVLYQKQHAEPSVTVRSKNTTIAATPEDKDVHEALSFIPQNLSYDERMPINFSIFSHCGSEGISILSSHWDKSDRKKLLKDLQNQFKSHSNRSGNKYSIGTLFHEAKKNGFVFKGHAGKNNRGSDLGNEPTYPVSKLYPVDEGQRKLECIVGDFLIKKKDTAVMVEAGLGKTRTTIQKLAQEHKKRNGNFRVAYFVTSHRIASERLDDFYDEVDMPNVIKEIGGVRVIKGFKHNCELIANDDYDSIYDKNTCDKCYINTVEHCCKHINQYGWRTKDRTIIPDRFRIYQQAHLFMPSTSLDRDWKPDVIVIDEDIVSNKIQILTIGKGLCQVVTDIISDTISGAELNDVLKQRYKQLKKENRNLIIQQKSKDLTQKDRDNMFILSSLQKIGKYYTRKDDDCVKPDVEIWLEGETLYLGRLKPIHEKWDGIPMLYLDASGSEEIIDTAIERNFEFHKIRCQYQKNVEVVQVENNSVSKGWINKNPQKIIETIESFDRYSRTCFISYKNVNKIPFIRAIRPDNKKLSWFGGLRGSNRFQDYSTLVVVGRHRIDSTCLIRYAKVLFKDWQLAPIHDDSMIAPRTIRMKHKPHLTLDQWSYVDERLQMLSEHFDKAETYQAIHRLRLLHGDDLKRVVYVSNDVVDVTVDRLITYEQLRAGILFFDDFIRWKQVWKFNDNKGMEKSTGLPERSIREFKKNHSPWFDVKKLDVIEIKSRKKKNLEFIVVKGTTDSALQDALQKKGYELNPAS